MSRVAYVNGRYIRHAAAGVSIDDRAFLFADGIYEVIEVFDGRLIDEEDHLLRLARSAAELRLTLPMAATALRRILRELVARNRVTDGHVYLQVTRGAAKRDHGFPKPGTPATVVAFAHRGDRAAAEARAHAGIKVISLPDIRWKRPDIKTTSLLPNVLAKQQAKEVGAYEAWLVDADGFVTEGSSSNAWIVDSAGVLVTHPADSAILAGITRARLLKIGAARGLKIEERPFTLAEAFRAQEAFISGATTIVLPVVAIDGQNIGSGAPGAVALGLRASFHKFAPATA
jgi:D-alanine transaminase